MRAALALCFSIFAACGVSNAVDELTTVTIGADRLSPIRIERTARLGPDRLPACLDVSIDLPASDATLELTNVERGCLLTLHEPDLVIFNEQEAKQAQKSAGPFEIDGVESGSVVLKSLTIEDGAGVPIDLQTYVHAVTIAIDGEKLIDGIDPAALEGDGELRRSIPAPVLDEIKQAVRNDENARAEVTVGFLLARDHLTDIPDTITVRAVLQPQFKVNVIDAAF